MRAGGSCGRSWATSPASRRWRCLFDLALLYLLKVNFSRLWVLTSWALVVPAVPLARLLVKQAALELGHWLQPTVIVGTGPNAREIAAAYDARNNHLGYQVQAFLDPAASRRRRERRTLRVGGRDDPGAAAGRARPRSCRAGSASRTWWWRWSSTRCSGARG